MTITATPKVSPTVAMVAASIRDAYTTEPQPKKTRTNVPRTSAVSFCWMVESATRLLPSSGVPRGCLGAAL